MQRQQLQQHVHMLQCVHMNTKDNSSAALQSVCAAVVPLSENLSYTVLGAATVEPSWGYTSAS